jgi:hypothetical protein
MSDNVINFPGYLFIDGYYLHHCTKFRTLHALVDDISQKDYERSLAWDRRLQGHQRGPTVSGKQQAAAPPYNRGLAAAESRRQIPQGGPSPLAGIIHGMRCGVTLRTSAQRLALVFFGK